MSINRNELLDYLSQFLNVELIKDYCPNGLQVEGQPTIRKIVTGVTASQALVDQAAAMGADMLLVHHGYFWKGEPQTIVGLKKNRIKTLLTNDINLVGYHLPIDVHPEVGNNNQLGKQLEIENIRPSAGFNPVGIVYQGQLKVPMTVVEFEQHLSNKLNRPALAVSAGNRLITSVAWCTGGGQSFIDQAAEIGIDAFISGEISEQTVHSARELGIHFFSAGHHATERYGIKSLGEHIKAKFEVAVEFVDIDNPA